MPANYAHHRFGTQALATLPADVRRPIQRFRRLYNIGLHGPDLFFYFNPFLKTATGALGNHFHSLSGREFFTQVCTRLHQHPSEAALAYLYGLLGHYCLDSACHPFVEEAATGAKFSHIELEVEFDRFLMNKDGMKPPHTQDLSSYFQITRGECITVSEFYPPATAANIHQCVQNITLSLKILATRHRKALETLLKPMPEVVAHQLMPQHPNHKCFHLDEALLEHYQQALDRYPSLVEQLTAHLNYNAQLGEDFTATFG